MSKTVDERVVEMRFDNQQFERNVQTSLSTLDKLKHSLNLSGATKGLDNINFAAKNVNMNSLGDAIETVRARFSALDVVGVTALANITNSAVNAGKRIVSSLTIDQVTAGWSKYEQKTASVQSLMNSSGKTLDEINGYLDKLMWYSDETSYGFTDMTSALATMVSSGGDINKLIPMIEGVANATAFAGKGASEFSRIMQYAVNQAYSLGYMQVQDWKSIEGATVNSKQLIEQLIKAGEELGKIEKGTVTIENFRNSLADKWLDKDVMEQGFGAFSKVTEEIYKGIQNGTFENYADGLAKIGDKYGEFAQRAAASSQEAKTFTEAIDATKDAVSSGWMQTSELIFGNYEEAKKLWTDVANSFWDIFASGSESRNDILGSVMNSKWDQLVAQMEKAGVSAETFQNKIKETAKEHGIAIDDLIKEYGSLGKVISAGKLSKGIIVETIKKMAGYFDKTSKAVNVTTDNLKHFQGIVNKVIRGDFGNGVERINALSKAGENYAVVQGLVNKVWERNGYTWKDTTIKAEDLASVINNLSEKELQNLGYTEEQAKALKELAKQAEETGTPLNELIENLNKPSGRELVFDTIHNALEAISKVLGTVRNAWSDVFIPERTSNAIYKFLEALNKLSKKLVLSDASAEKLRRTFRGVFATLDIVMTLVGGPLKLAFKIFVQLLNALDLDVLDVTASIGDAIVRFDEWLNSTFDLSGVFKALAPYIKKAASAIRDFMKDVKNSKYVQQLASHINDLGKRTKEWLASLKDTKFVQQLIANLKVLTERTKEWFASLKDTKFIKDLIAHLKEASKAIKDWAKGLKDTENIPKYIFEGLVNGFKNGITKIAEWALKIGETILTTIKDYLGIHSPSTKAMEIGRNIVEGLILGIKNALGSLWDAVASIGEGILAGLKNLDWGKIISVAFGAGILISMKDTLTVLKNLTTPIMTFSELLNSVVSVIKGFGSALSKAITRMSKAAAFKTIANSILEFAIAIGILAGSLYLISKIEPDRLWKSVGAIAALAGIIAVLAGVVALLNKKSFKSIADGKSKSGADEAVKTVLALCAAILIIAIAIKKVASIGDPKAINTAVEAIDKVIIAAGSMIILFGALAKGKNTRNIDKAGDTFLKIGAVMLIMAISMRMIGRMNPEAFDQAMVAVVAFGIVAAGLIAVTKFAGKNAEKAGNAMLSIGGAFVLMAFAVKMLGKIDPDQLKQGVDTLVEFGIMVLILIAATQFAGDKSVAAAGGAMLMIAGAFILMAYTVKILGEMKPEAIKQGIRFLGLFATMIVILIAIITLIGDGASLKAGGAMIMIAGSMAIMAMVVKMVSGMRSEEIKKGIAVMTAFSLMIIGLIAVTKFAGKNAAKAGVAMTGIAVAIGIMAAVVFMIGQMEPEAIKKGLIAVGFLSLFMMGLMVASHFAEKCVGTVIAITVAVAILSVAVTALSYIEPEKLAGAVIAIGTLMLIFAGLMVVSQYADGSLGTLIALTVMVAIIGAVLYALGTLPVESSLAATFGLSAVLIAISIACLALSAIPIIGALTAVANLAIFIAGLTLILAALGGLSKIPGFNELIKDGGETLALIGYAIGKFVGSIVGGAMAGISSGLPEIGANLSAFILNATPFIVGVKMVDESALKGVGILTAAILALTAASFIEGLTKFNPFAPSFADMGKQLSEFMINAMPFIIGISAINEGAANGAKSLAQMLLALTAADILQGLTSWLTGGTSLADFGAQLAPFGVSIATFSNAVKNVDGASVQAAANAGKTMAEMAKVLPTSGGFWEKIIGKKDMKEFGEKIVAFGESIVTVSNTLSETTINEAAINSATSAGKSMAELSKALPKTDGIWQEIAGKKDISDFGEKIVAFAKSMVSVSNALGDATINESAVASAVTAGNKLLDLQEVLPKSGGWWEKIAGEKDISDFGDKIEKFAEKMKTFSDKCSEIKSFGSTNNIVSIAQSLTGIAKRVEDMDCGKLVTFGEKAEEFAGKMASFATKTSEVDTATLNTAISGVQSLVTLADSITGKDYSNLSTLATSLEKLGNTSVDKFISSFKSAAPKAAAAGKALITGVIKGVSAGVPTLNKMTAPIAQKMPTAFKAKQGEFGKIGKASMTQFANGIKTGSAASANAFSSALSKSISNAKGYWSSFYNAGAFVAEGFASGIDANAFRGEIAARAMAEAAYEAAKEVLKINSPSKIFRALAAAIPEGFAQGIYRNLGMVSNSATNMAETAINSTRNVISRIADVIQGGIDTQPTIRPVLDLSEVKSGASTIGEMFNINPSVGMMANIGSINSMMSRRQNGSNDDVITAINDLGRRISDSSGNTYNSINGVTYSDESEVSDAIRTIVRAARIERRT